MISLRNNISRRSLLKKTACGFGSIALAGLNHANAEKQNSLLARPSILLKEQNG